VLQLIRDGRQVPTGSGGGHLRGERLPGLEAELDALAPSPQVRRVSGEQSNTSMVFDDKVILKIIRKVEAGVNPEYEMGRFLATHGFTAAPPMVGAVQLEGGQAGTTLAVAHRFIGDAQDGWAYVRERFRDWPNTAGSLIPEVRELGQRMGELHRVLGSDPGDPAFAPDPVQLEDLQRWSASIIGELGVTLNDASKRFPQVFDRRAALVDRMKLLAHRTPAGKKIRIHGDLHLGQVLRTKDQWLIFDFEGEPLRKLAQRREKQSPLKDVAGMVRSFEYADATVEREGHPAKDRVTRTRQAFLEGYLDAVRGSDLVPESPQDFAGFLDAFEVEKLLYEIRYELTNRPDWARIPIEALMREEGIS
jgi:trehalose synthase-fused probable maltokinase